MEVVKAAERLQKGSLEQKVYQSKSLWLNIIGQELTENIMKLRDEYRI